MASIQKISMFDEQPKVVDMFDSTEKPVEPRPTPPMAQPSPVMPSPSLPPKPPAMATYEPGPQESSFSVVKGVLLLVLVLALIGGAGYAAWRLMSQQSSNDGPVRSVGDGGIVAPGTDEEDASDDTAGATDDATDDPKIPEGRSTLLDSDGDGLTNAEELEAGTDVGEPDTDSDGLGDREEVKVYGTNPRKVDTDGDTFLDGQEVAGGYNPNGEGKLFNVPTE